MVTASREFQVFAKPIGSRCNLDCHYCYYLQTERLYRGGKPMRMPDDVLESYIVQHIDAAPQEVIGFSWHGGEPTILGLDYFRTIVALQRKHQRPGRRIINAMQTNGTLLDDDWCRFLSSEGFGIGLSLDGPQEMHDRHRVTKGQEPTFHRTMHGHDLLKRHGIAFDILCVVHAQNVIHPIELYRFFKEIGTSYIGFLPLVERLRGSEGDVGSRSVTAEAFGAFLCTIYDEWLRLDIGRIKVQIFEEAARTAFGGEHSLCIFRKTCGDVPVIEHNGDFFSCDHFVNVEHRLGNIRETPLVDLIESPAQRAFGDAKLSTLPPACLVCDVREMCNGGCPKDRFLRTPDGNEGLNYLCAGYKQFFRHCRPFVSELSAEWRQQQSKKETSSTPVKSVSITATRTGRNDPCPCGSGRKYKKCCMGK